MVSRVVNFCDREHTEGVDTMATESVTFMVDGDAYEMDLCAEHRTAWDAFEHDQQVWKDAARLKRKSTRKSRANNGQEDRPARDHRSTEERRETAAVRAWALQQGLTTSTRGRIPDELRQQYRQAQEREANTRWNAAGSSAPRPLTPPPTPSLRPSPVKQEEPRG